MCGGKYSRCIHNIVLRLSVYKMYHGGIGMKKVARPLLWTLFVFYCLVLITVLFISRPERPSLSYADYFREYTNFIPFKTTESFLRGMWADIGRVLHGQETVGRGWIYYSINLAGNFVLFLPMGMMLPCLFARLNRFWKVTLTVLAMVVLVELTQGLLRVGSIDVDDLIFNLSGGMLGYGIIRLVGVSGVLRKTGITRL